MIASLSSSQLILHPSTAFGKGDHPSTFLVIELLHDLAAHGFHPKTTLDMGCGTGILSMISHQLFGCQVIAVDLSQHAIHTTRDNATLNACDHAITALHANGFNHPALDTLAPVDLLLFNILAEPAISMARSILRHTDNSGIIMLSGILSWQRQMVMDAYRLLGCDLLAEATHESWCCLAFIKSSQE